MAGQEAMPTTKQQDELPAVKTQNQEPGAMA